MYLTPAKETWVGKNADEKANLLTHKSVKNIGIIKHGALGDMVHTRPMIISLREEFPKAKITLGVIEHYMQGIPEDLIDELHITKGKGTPKKEVWKSLKTMLPQDILFDITASSRSMWISLFTQATLKIGYIHKGLHRLFYDIAIPRAHYRFEAETFAEQLNAIGLDFEWPLVYKMPDVTMDIDNPYIVYFPTASVSYKLWPEKYYKDLLKLAVKQHPNYHHILLSGVADWEKKVAERIIDSVNNSELQLIYGGEQTDSIIANATLLVSGDTGIRNLAIAYGTPTIGIFNPLSAVACGYRPYFGNHPIVYDKYGSDVQVNKVINVLDGLLEAF